MNILEMAISAKMGGGGNSGGQGGVSSWNDLKDKPFGETTATSDTLTWDGNTEGKDVYSTGVHFKVSDDAPSLADLANGFTVEINNNGAIQVYDNTTVSVTSNENGYALMLSVFPLVGVVTSPDEETGAKVGVYFAKEDSIYGDLVVNRFTINGYNGFGVKAIKTLDPKYLPNGVPYEEGGTVEILSERELTVADIDQSMGLFTFSNMPDLVEGSTYVVNYGGTEYECVCGTSVQEGTTMRYIGNGIPFGAAGNNEPFIFAQYPAEVAALVGVECIFLPMINSFVCLL